METFVSKIFKKRPEQWGLRGDPYLLDELENYFSNIKIPYPEEEFKEAICVAFEKFTEERFILRNSSTFLNTVMVACQAA